jgi:3-hydroxy acid dehydrogenase / malonic semialdehyde reductase
MALHLDVTDNSAVDALPEAIPASFQPIVALINSAGHDPGGTTRFDLGSADDWQSAIETNLLGTMRVTRALLPGMIERNAGDIVSIGSIASLRLCRRWPRTRRARPACTRSRTRCARISPRPRYA